jgi:hypothetical protein
MTHLSLLERSSVGARRKHGAAGTPPILANGSTLSRAAAAHLDL